MSYEGCPYAECAGSTCTCCCHEPGFGGVCRLVEINPLDREVPIFPMDDKIKSDGSSSAYYEIPPGAKEIQDLVEHRNMNFAVGNIFKAAYRLGKKAGNDDLYELRKIKWYAERELKRLENLQQEKA